MNTMAAAWVLALKDLKSFFRDRTALMLSILVPIALVTVFGWIMAYAFGSSSGMPKVTLHILDSARSLKSEQLIKRLETHEMLRVKRVADSEPHSIADAATIAEKLVRGGDANHVLIVHDPAASEAGSDRYPEMKLVRDPGRQMEDRIVQLSLMQVTIQEQGDKVLTNSVATLLVKQGMPAEDISAICGWMADIGGKFGDFFEDAAKAETVETAESPRGTNGAAHENSPPSASAEPTTPSPAAVPADESGVDLSELFEFAREVMPMETVDVAPPGRKQQVTFQQAQSVCGMTVMMLLFALTNCGSVLLSERENGTLRRLFSQPISRNSILLGKFIFVFMIGVLQMTVLFCYGEWMFRVGLFRDPVSLAVISLTWIAAAGAFGIFLAAISRSARQAESLASLLILMMAALGGCWFPLQMMDLPPLLDAVCKSTMTYWAMTGYQGLLWNQLPWYSPNTLMALGWQWAWCLGLTVLAIFFYRRNYCRG